MAALPLILLSAKWRAFRRSCIAQLKCCLAALFENEAALQRISSPCSVRGCFRHPPAATNLLYACKNRHKPNCGNLTDHAWKRLPLLSLMSLEPHLLILRRSFAVVPDHEYRSA